MDLKLIRIDSSNAEKYGLNRDLIYKAAKEGRSRSPIFPNLTTEGSVLLKYLPSKFTFPILSGFKPTKVNKSTLSEELDKKADKTDLDKKMDLKLIRIDSYYMNWVKNFYPFHISHLLFNRNTSKFIPGSLISGII